MNENKPDRVRKYRAYDEVENKFEYFNGLIDLSMFLAWGEKDNNSISDFTGYHDTRTGAEVYEGDEVEVTENFPDENFKPVPKTFKGIVEHSPNGWIVKDDDYTAYLSNAKEIHITGNIYQNQPH